jgi:hypothetical protein
VVLSIVAPIGPVVVSNSGSHASGHDEDRNECGE